MYTGIDWLHYLKNFNVNVTIKIVDSIATIIVHMYINQRAIIRLIN